MDATKPWPIPDRSLDAIVCDHVIEHVSFLGASFLVGEAHRVLRSNGVLRVSTPDMEVVGALIRGEALDYAVWSNEKYGDPAEGSNPVFTVNRLVREWGHTFIYDEATLTAMFLRAGFGSVRRESLGASQHEFLRGVDSHAKEVGEEPYAFESMIFDAAK